MIDLTKLHVRINGFALNAQLMGWVRDNLDEFESEQDDIEQIGYWVDNNVGRFMEVVVK